MNDPEGKLIDKKDEVETGVAQSETDVAQENKNVAGIRQELREALNTKDHRQKDLYYEIESILCQFGTGIDKKILETTKNLMEYWDVIDGGSPEEKVALLRKPEIVNDLYAFLFLMKKFKEIGKPVSQHVTSFVENALLSKEPLSPATANIIRFLISFFDEFENSKEEREKILGEMAERLFGTLLEIDILDRKNYNRVEDITSIITIAVGYEKYIKRVRELGLLDFLLKALESEQENAY